MYSNKITYRDIEWINIIIKVKIKVTKPPISHVNQLPYYYVFFHNDIV